MNFYETWSATSLVLSSQYDASFLSPVNHPRLVHFLDEGNALNLFDELLTS
jgi:hypothetical protein